MEIENLTESFSKELVSESCDPILDIAEIGLDSILDDSIIKEIPILKTIAAVCKVGLNIRDRYFAKNLIIFINGFRKGKIDNEKYDGFKFKMEDVHFRRKVTETIIVRLDRIDNISKTTIITNLFISFINQRINWDEFVAFSSIVNNLEYEDYETLKLLYEMPNKDHICFSTHERKDLKGSAYKLAQFSLVDYDVMLTATFGTIPAAIFHKINEKGIKFYESIGNL